MRGDWNAKVGSGEEIYGVVGNFGLGERNDSGQHMSNFAARNNLKIADKFFPEKPKRMVMSSPDNTIRNERHKNIGKRGMPTIISVSYTHLTLPTIYSV